MGSEQHLRKVVFASGGHLRTLFAILKELILILNARGAPLPASTELVDEAIGKVAFGFSSITREDAELLRRIDGSADGAIEPASDEIQRLARLLRQHMVLAHLNGQLWFEVHPLARRGLGLP